MNVTKNLANPAAICLAILWCLTAMCSPKTPPTVQPAPEVTTTTSTANEQDANVLVVPSLIHTPLPSIVTESQALVPVAVEAPYTPPASPPTRNAATATGRTYSQPVYQMPRRRLFVRWRR